DSIELFSKYKVYSEKELTSRFNILAEAYVKTLDIEAKTALMMAKGQILPAALRYQTEVAGSVAAAKSAGIASPPGMETLNTLVAAIGDLTKGIATLEKATGHHAEGDAFAHAKHMREDVFPAL